MIDIHHLATSQSERVVWLCEELEVPYRLLRYERDPISGLAPLSYRELHPAGTAPVITDGDISLAESGAIIEYIARKHGKGRLLLGESDPDFYHFLFTPKLGRTPGLRARPAALFSTR